MVAEMKVAVFHAHMHVSDAHTFWEAFGIKAQFGGVLNLDHLL